MGRFVAPRSGAAGIPGPHPHCGERCLTTIRVVGLVFVGPHVRSGTNGDLASRPAGGLRRIPPKTPHAYDADGCAKAWTTRRQ